MATERPRILHLDIHSIGKKRDVPANEHMIDTKEGLLGVLAISPKILRLVDKLYRAVESNSSIDTSIASEAVTLVVDDDQQLAMISRLGYDALLRTLRLEILEAFSIFIADEDMKPDSASISKKYRGNLKNITEYATKYSLVPFVINTITTAVNTQLARWAIKNVDVQLLNPENMFAQEQDACVGELLQALASEFADLRENELDEEDKLDEVAFADLAEYLLAIVQQEFEYNSVLVPTEQGGSETMAKVLIQLTAARYAPMSKSVIRKFSPELFKVYKYGQPLFQLFGAFFQQLPKAITDEDHPGHKMAIDLVNLLNSFQLEALPAPDNLKSQPFSYQMCYGLIVRDLVDDVFNYQDFICKLDKLSSSEGPEQMQYQTYLDYVLMHSQHIARNIIFSADTIKDILFDLEQVQHFDVNVGEVLQTAFLQHNIPQLSVATSRDKLVSEFPYFRLPDSTTQLTVRQMAPDVYIINIALATFTDDKTTAKTKLTKFRYQIRIDHNQVSLDLPVIDPENITPDMKAAALEHFNNIMVFMKADLEEETVRPARQQHGRQERMDEYSRERQEHQQTNGRLSTVRNVRSRMMEISDVERETLNRFLPSELVISKTLDEIIASEGKKGRLSSTYQALSQFIPVYNSSGSIKPGKGEQIIQVYGPNNQRVFSFQLKLPHRYDRFLAVDVGNGVGVIYDVGDHRDVYGDIKDMRRKVAKAVTEFGENIPSDT